MKPLNTFLAVVRNETRLLWRRRAFWIVQALLLVPAGLMIGAVVFGQELPLDEFSVPGLIILPLIYLMLPILIGPAALRDLGQVGELLWSSPLDAGTHLLGVFCGLWVGLLPGTLLQLGGWFLVDLFAPNLLGAWAWLYALLIQLLANTLVVALVLLLAALLRRTLPLLMTWTALWVWIWVKVIFSEGLSEGFNPLYSLAMWNVFFSHLKLSPSLGLGLSKQLVEAMLLWFLGLALIALVLAWAALWLTDRRRATRRAWLWPIPLALALLVAGIGYFGYGRALAAHADPTSPHEIQADTWEVLSQDTRVTVDVNSGQIDGFSTLVLSTRKALEAAEVVLRLNPGLELTAAGDGTGGGYPFERNGDSVIIELPGLPVLAVLPVRQFTLVLEWQGRLRIPFLAFQQQWKWSTAPYPSNLSYMPMPMTALLQPQAGFLLRDGDWRPWPWETGAHEAAQNNLSLRLEGARVLSPVPMQGDNIVLQGKRLPKALLAYISNPKTIALGQNGTIFLSPLVSVPQSKEAEHYAAALAYLRPYMDQSVPHQVVVTPYLNDLVWSGDLLLIPDGSGEYHMSSNSLTLPSKFAGYNLSGEEYNILLRYDLALVLRAWLVEKANLGPTFSFVPVVIDPTQTPPTTNRGPLRVDRWYAQSGRWMETLENFDNDAYWWTPRSATSLGISGRWSTLAFWLAMELSSEEVRQGDLELMDYLLDLEQSNLGFGTSRDLISSRLWTPVMMAKQARQMVVNLHAWAQEVANQPEPQDPVAVVFETLFDVLDENQPKENIALWDELAKRSGVPLEGVWP